MTPAAPWVAPPAHARKPEGRFGKQDFRCVAGEDVYICPAGERLAYSFTTQDKRIDSAPLRDERLSALRFRLALRMVAAAPDPRPPVAVTGAFERVSANPVSVSWETGF